MSARPRPAQERVEGPVKEPEKKEVKDKKEGDGLSSLEERLKKLQSKKKAGAD